MLFKEDMYMVTNTPDFVGETFLTFDCFPQRFCSSPRRNRAEFSELNEPDSNAGDGKKIKVVGMIIFFRGPYIKSLI